MIAVTSAGMEVLETAGLNDPDGGEIPVGFHSAPSTGVKLLRSFRNHDVGHSRKSP